MYNQSGKNHVHNEYEGSQAQWYVGGCQLRQGPYSHSIGGKGPRGESNSHLTAYPSSYLRWREDIRTG